MNKTLMVLTSVAPLLCISGTANAAGTIQGTLGVTITIGAGCVVTGGNSSGTTNDFGSISFGTYSRWPTSSPPAPPAAAVPARWG